jgi:beta-lactamase class A
MEESSLSNDALAPLLKGIVLRWKVDQTIKDDEAQQIVTGVKIVDLQFNKNIVNHEADTEQFAASINKLPVALLVLQDLRSGKLSMDQTLTWVPSDRRAGGGVYDSDSSPLQAKLSDVLYDMLNRSGNTAVRIFVNYTLGLAPAVNERWSHIPQLSHTYLMPLSDPTRFYLGNSTPHDSLWTLQQLMGNRDRYGKFVYDALAANPYTDYGTRNQLAGNDYIVLVNKLGLLNDPDGDNRHDVGIIYNTRTHKSYAYAYMTTSPESNTAALPQAEQSLKDMGRYTLRYAGDKPQKTKQSSPGMTSMSVTQTEGKILY